MAVTLRLRRREAVPLAGLHFVRLTAERDAGPRGEEVRFGLKHGPWPAEDGCGLCADWERGTV